MRRLRQFLRHIFVNAFLILTITCAVMAILIPSTNLFSKISWVGSTIFFVTVFILIRSRKKIKNGFRKNNAYIVIEGTNEYEHRSKAKKILRRNLRPNEVVHHINGQRSDNSLKNLCVMDRLDHELFHAWLDWKKKKDGRYPTFKDQKQILTDKYNGILLEGKSQFKLNANSTLVPHPFVIEKSKITPVASSEISSQDLFSDLRRERMRLAREQHIPAYLIFKDVTLTEMAQRRPEDFKSMRCIIGVNSEKLRLYGDCFLAVIRKHIDNADTLEKKKSV